MGQEGCQGKVVAIRGILFEAGGREVQENEEAFAFEALKTLIAFFYPANYRPKFVEDVCLKPELNLTHISRTLASAGGHN